MKVEAYVCDWVRSAPVDITPFLDDLPVQEIEFLRQEGNGVAIFHREDGEENSYHLFSGRVASVIRSRLVTGGALGIRARSITTWGSSLYVNYKALNDYYLNRVSKDAVDSLLDGYEL